MCLRIDRPIDSRPAQTGLVEAGPARLAPALLPAATIALLGLAGGGFEPETWGWATLALIAAAVLALAVFGPPRTAPFELVFVGSLAALGGWMLASSAWSLDQGQAVLEAERVLLYLAGVIAMAFVARRSSLPTLLGGLLAGIAVVSLYGLSLRLFPESVGAGAVALAADPTAGVRLAEPLGYSNALGGLAALGISLALVLGAEATTSTGRMAAAALLPALATTLYLTFSRGAWLALGIGLAAALAIARHRLRLAAGWIAFAPPAALAVLLASRSDALLSRTVALGDLRSDGRRLALALVLLAALAAASAFGFGVAERRLSPGLWSRRAFAVVLGVLAVGTLVLVLIRVGGPGGVYDAFDAQPAPAEADIGERLFSLSGSSRSEYWRVAWEDFEDHPLLGSGAGSYPRRWLQYRPAELPGRDAHSLYLETLAELGPLGMLFLLVALAAPLAAATRARTAHLAAGALAAYCCFLAHAAIDWDWEMPVVTLAGLLAGVALLAAARPSDVRRETSRRALAGFGGAAVAAASLAGLALVGNRALAQSTAALDRGDTSEAARHARRAARFSVWQSEPWRLLGEAQLADGDLAAARRSFRKGLVKDDRSWELWLGLALAAEGRQRREALARAKRLNPRERDLLRLEIQG